MRRKRVKVWVKKTTNPNTYRAEVYFETTFSILNLISKLYCTVWYDGIKKEKVNMY